MAALTTACEEYTCLDFATCRSPDAATSYRPSEKEDGGEGVETTTGLGASPLTDSGTTQVGLSIASRGDGGTESELLTSWSTSADLTTSSELVTGDGQRSGESREASSSIAPQSVDAGADASSIDACALVTCGEHATCRVDGDSPVCECQRGFVGDGSVCQPAVFAVAAGFEHSCALVGEGRVRCWGSNTAAMGLGFSELNGEVISGSTPASQLPDIDLGDARTESISAGGHTTCVVLTSGHVRCWGGNGHGEIGLIGVDTLGDDESPNSLAFNVDFGAELRVSQVVTGWMHTCVLFDNGKVRCWGLGQHGQLGNGNTTDWGSTEERSVANQTDVRLSGRAVQVAVGQYHSCALLESGQVVCWGDNEYGQLGLGNTVNMGDNETALEAANLGPDTKALQIGAGDDHTCALLDTGSVRCWGANYYGQLGLGNTGRNEQDDTAKFAYPRRQAWRNRRHRASVRGRRALLRHLRQRQATLLGVWWLRTVGDWEHHWGRR